MKAWPHCILPSSIALEKSTVILNLYALLWSVFFSPSGSSQDLLPSQLSDSPQRCVFNMSLFSTIMLGLRWLSNVKTHVHYFYKFFLYSFTDDSFFLCSLFLVLLLFKHYNSWDGMGWSESSVSSLHTSLNSPFFSMIPGFQLFLVPIPLLFSPETTTLSSL